MTRIDREKATGIRPDELPVPSPQPLALFVYGTLTDDRFVRELTGKRFAREPAVLDGYQRIKPDRGYPYIVVRPGASVEGWLLRGLDRASLARIDEYEGEGDLYRRAEVVVRTAGGERRCFVYVGVPERIESDVHGEIDA